MTKDEKMIRNLRRRRPSIVAGVIILVMTSGALAFTINRKMKLDAIVTPERIRTMATYNNPKEELPELFYRFHKLAAYDAKIMCYGIFFSVLVGLSLGLLIAQIANVTNRPLLVSMWDQHLLYPMPTDC
jgi:hypothetical protein